jgi:hypothetical protein
MEHEHTAGTIEQKRLPGEARVAEDESAQRRFVLQIIQPGLVGLMDGSVSTLAPVFAAAFATHNSWNAFLVGMAASLGAGISMGFAEALADDGKLSGRGTPFLRGLVCGLMTIAGGIGHTLPYLIPDFLTATVVAGVVVGGRAADDRLDTVEVYGHAAPFRCSGSIWTRRPFPLQPRSCSVGRWCSPPASLSVARRRFDHATCQHRRVAL